MTETSPDATAIPSPVNEPIAAAREPLVFRAPRPDTVTRGLLGLFLLAALGFVAANVLHPGRAQRLRVLDASESRLESMMLALENDNERLMGELRRLERGAQGWQALARKEYGMLLEGEYVYRFPSSP